MKTFITFGMWWPVNRHVLEADIINEMLTSQLINDTEDKAFNQQGHIHLATPGVSTSQLHASSSVLNNDLNPN